MAHFALWDVEFLNCEQRQLFWPLLLPHPIMLPKFLQLLIDAHGSDVPLVSLNHFTPFTRSIHQLAHHNPTPLSHSALQRSKVTPAETLRMTAYQPIQQLPGRGVRLALKPVQYLAPHSFEWIRTRPPRVRLSRFLRVRHSIIIYNIQVVTEAWRLVQQPRRNSVICKKVEIARPFLRFGPPRYLSIKVR